VRAGQRGGARGWTHGQHETPDPSGKGRDSGWGDAHERVYAPPARMRVPLTTPTHVATASSVAAAGDLQVLEGSDLERLIAALRDDGYEVMGPTVRDGAILYDAIASAAELPAGWLDLQEPGRCRLVADPDAGPFDYTVGLTSWKRFLFPSDVVLARVRVGEDGLEISGHDAAPRLAFLGVRACELAAIAVQDRVLAGGPWVDPIFRERRAAAFVVAVECRRIGSLCFCASMGTGPRVTGGYDLRLVSVRGGREPAFAIDAGTERGHALLARLPVRTADGRERAAATAPPAGPPDGGRAIDTDGLPALLAANLEHPRWDDVAQRCLSCGNCTQVCPTCFCFSFEEVSDLTGRDTARVRRWDTCFATAHSYIHGGSLRPSTRSRYRQWLTHKLGTWHDQFGMSGCVGCGRCIAWCPAGIDLTEEVRALRLPGRPKENQGAHA
jgi:sulfhydrogenase subunit beta (sulfur reductase)